MDSHSGNNTGTPGARGLPRGWSGASAFRVLVYVVAAASLVVSLGAFWRGFRLPLLEEHSFRQTQTALASYWFIHGGDWLAYELPVLGSPWRVPLELPIYQWIVAAVGSLAPTRLDQIGRAVSYLFHLLCLIPIHSLVRRFQPGREHFLVAMSLFLAAPVYLFWSRTFMIESAALFFALAFVALYARWLGSGEWGTAAAASLMGTAGILQKVTTFLPFLLLAGVLSVPPVLQLLRSRRWREFGVRSTLALAIAGVPVLLLLWWVGYSDQVKSLHPIANVLTSDRLTLWTFGTLEQRLGNELWTRIILGRALPEAVGNPVVLWIALGMAALLPRRAQLSVLVLGATYLASFLIFTNLHIVHNYYQCANAVLLAGVLAVIIPETAKARPLAAALFLVLVIASQWQSYRTNYHPKLGADFTQGRTLQVSNFIRSQTPKDSAILVLGYDWSSEVAYYSERKSLTLPKWADEGVKQKILESPSSFTKPLPVSAVVVCWDRVDPRLKQLAEEALPRLPVRAAEKIAGCDVLLTERGP